MAGNFSRQQLTDCSRRQLQQLAKQYGIPANLKSSVIIDRLIQQESQAQDSSRPVNLLSEDDSEEQSALSYDKVLNPEPVQGQALLPLLKHVKDKRGRFTRERSLPVVEALEGRVSVDARGENRDGGLLWSSISAEFTSYLKLNEPDLFARIDPWIVVVDITSPNFPAMAVYKNFLNGYPPQPPAQHLHGTALPKLVPLNGSNFVFAFGGGTNGAFRCGTFIGALKHAFPTVLAWRFDAPIPIYL